jgi:nitrogen fixation NifU-like protein
MKDSSDKMDKEIQELLIKHAKEAYGDAVFERMTNPRYMGIIMDADAFGQVKGDCGDTVVVYLRFEDGRVKNAAFQTNGCGATIACGSYAAELVRGKAPGDILDITGESILNYCGGLPEENEHCATLAADALHEAANKYLSNQASKTAAAFLEKEEGLKQ